MTTTKAVTVSSWWWYTGVLAFLLAVLIVLYGRDIQLLDSASPLRQRYLGVGWLVLIHGALGALALFIVPFQFSNRLRQGHIHIHRFMGRLYVLGVFIAAPLAIPIAIVLGPPHLIMAATIQAFGWMATTATAIYCIRTGRIQQHREWMMRSYPFAMVFLAARVILGIPPIERMGEVAFISVVWSVIAVASFLPSLLIAWKGVHSVRAVPIRP